MRLLEIRELNKTITEDNLQQIRETVETVIKAGVIANYEGLLDLEEFTKQNNYDLLNKGIMLVVDGAEPEYVRAILENKYYANGYTGVDALCNIIIIEGILNIQEGMNPIALETLIRSMLSDRIDSKLDESIYKLVREKYKADNQKNESNNEIVKKKSSGNGMLTAEEVRELLQMVPKQ